MCPKIQDVSSKLHERITDQISKNLWKKNITCLLKSVGLKSILVDFWRYQVLTILLSHGFLEIFEKYMSPKIRENIFQSHGFHGFHGFLEINPQFSLWTYFGKKVAFPNCRPLNINTIGIFNTFLNLRIGIDQ